MTYILYYILLHKSIFNIKTSKKDYAIMKTLNERRNMAKVPLVLIVIVMVSGMIGSLLRVIAVNKK